jgi:hypothetical protein
MDGQICGQLSAGAPIQRKKKTALQQCRHALFSVSRANHHARAGEAQKGQENMKKIIDGKRYDTETAEYVYRWDNGRFSTDFRYYFKVLYRTQKGAWFIYHDGGALIDTDIEVVSADDAYEFLAEHSEDTDAHEVIEQYFSDRVQEA